MAACRRCKEHDTEKCFGCNCCTKCVGEFHEVLGEKRVCSSCLAKFFDESMERKEYDVFLQDIAYLSKCLAYLNKKIAWADTMLDNMATRPDYNDGNNPNSPLFDVETVFQVCSMIQIYWKPLRAKLLKELETTCMKYFCGYSLE